MSSTPSATPTPASATPAVGQCWNATSDELAGFTWTGGPALACDGAHNAETAAVGTIPNTASAPYTSVPDAYETVVRSACERDAPLTAVFGANVTGQSSGYSWWQTGTANLYPTVTSVTPVLVGYEYFFPTADEWAAGQRWFRCDVGAITAVGANEFRRVNASFKAAFTLTPKFFGVCTDGKDPSGTSKVVSTTVPVGNLVACSTTTPWRLAAEVVLAKNKAERYPGSSAVLARAKSLCPASPLKRYFDVPNKLSWDSNGIKGVSCWEYDPAHKTG